MMFSMRRGGFDQLTPEHVSTVLARYNDEAVQDVLDLWSNFETEVDPDLASGDVNQILGEQVVTAASKAQAAVDKLYADDELTTPMKRAGTAQIQGSNIERVMRPGHEIESMDEFVEMVPEVAATAEHASSLRDPEVRRGMRDVEAMAAMASARRLTDDIVSAKTLFDQLRNSGVDPAPLENVLREQLDKHEMGDLLSMDAYPPREMRQQADAALMKFRQVQDTGKPAEQESIDTVNQVALQMANSSSATGHGTYADVINQVAEYQRGHGGVSPALADAIRAASANDRFGFLSSTLTDLRLDQAVLDNDADAVSDLTNGTKTLVTWGNDTEMSSKLIVDGRTGDGDDLTVMADMVFDEGMSEITPNVAAALNSLYASYGGGIHRTRNNVTEADTNYAAMVTAEGWQGHSKAGKDDRTPEQTTGHYIPSENNVVVADATFQYGDGVTNVVSHELGHALDSMIGEVAGSQGRRGFYSDTDPEFLALRSKLQEISSYGDTPDDTLLNWYYRNEADGAVDHNGHSGGTEMFAQGYAAYAAMQRMLADPEEGFSPAGWKETVFQRGGKSLLHGHAGHARDSGFSMGDIYTKRGEAGQAIYEFFDNFENTTLPAMMKSPVVVKKRLPKHNHAAAALGAPAPKSPQTIPNAVQVERAMKHKHATHGELNMTEMTIGSPEYEAAVADIKAANPDATPIPKDAIFFALNPDWKTQGNTVLWKAVRPGRDQPTKAYSSEHKTTQHAVKFQRQKAVDEVVADIRTKALSEAMDDPVAALVAILAETGMRVGKGRSMNPKTKKYEDTYGGTSLLAKHVFFPSDNLTRIRFIGKSHKLNTYETRDPVIRAALKQAIEGKKPSEPIFPTVTPTKTEHYAREASGMPNLINHDLRTYMATNTAREAIAKWFKKDMPKNEAELKREKMKVAKIAGAAINDKWDTALKSYISPAVWEPFERSAGVGHEFDDSEQVPNGLIEGDVVESINGPAVGGPAAPAGGEAPPAVAAAAAAEDDEEVVSHPIDWSPEAVAERHGWYQSYQWPGGDVVAPPFPEDAAEDQSDATPVPEEAVAEEEA
jgi:hypothetical protein